MCGKKRLCADDLAVCNIFYDCPGDRKPVKSRCSAADLIKNEQTPGGSGFQDIRDFRHLDHKGTLSARQIIRRADAGEDPVHNTDLCRFRGHEAPDLRHEDDQGGLSHIGGFTGHIRSGDD